VGSLDAQREKIIAMWSPKAAQICCVKTWQTALAIFVALSSQALSLEPFLLIFSYSVMVNGRKPRQAIPPNLLGVFWRSIASLTA
jgi:hypothetical protein